jgi:transposase
LAGRVCHPDKSRYIVARRGDRLKILYWDRDGLAIWAKRLERGLFRFPEPNGNRVEVTPAEMAAILEGIDLSRARRQRRFVLPVVAATHLLIRDHLI